MASAQPPKPRGLDPDGAYGPAALNVVNRPTETNNVVPPQQQQQQQLHESTTTTSTSLLIDSGIPAMIDTTQVVLDRQYALELQQEEELRERQQQQKQQQHWTHPEQQQQQQQQHDVGQPQQQHHVPQKQQAQQQRNQNSHNHQQHHPRAPQPQHSAQPAPAQANTITGKALTFTQKVVNMHDTVIEKFQKNEAIAYLTDEFDQVNADDILYFTERMLHRQEAFANEGKTTHVDVGYKGLKNESLGRLRKDGLITKAEGNIPGVYTTNNPFSGYDASNDALLLVARLKGTVESASEQNQRNRRADTFVEDFGSVDEILVLSKSSQCVPILQIDSRLIHLDMDGSPGHDMIYQFHGALQMIVDQLFNVGHGITAVTRVIPSMANRTARPSGAPAAAPPMNLANTPRAASAPYLSRLPPPQPNHTGHGLARAASDRHRAGNHDATLAAMIQRSSGPGAGGADVAPPIPRNIHTTPTKTLETVVYYTGPDTAEKSFPMLTEAGLEQKIGINLDPGPHGNCDLCLKEVGTNDNVGQLPMCNHRFHIKCLMKRLKGNATKCPSCACDIGFLTQGLLIDANSKPAALIVDANFDLRFQQPLNSNTRHTHYCSLATNYLSIVPPKDGDGLSRKLTFAYACKSTFDVSLTDEMNRNIPDAWSAMFNDVAFLRRIGARVQEHLKKCSACKKALKKSQHKIFVGYMPTGFMRVERCPDLTCSGHQPGAFKIIYRIEEGIQKDYHPNPGEKHGATYREAYLPTNRDGEKLLKRLVYAFSRGMVFKIGTSLTTRLDNAVIWASITHKTNLTNDTFGFPDEKYFHEANEQLDALNVPPHDVL